ncbi:hypothetical protein [Dietzia sp. UCD-THP]|uniref:hypothetical protein n=1 Tax=Dietzia sp. UCD-THP TaxID=1292020 RepID=UPI00039A9A01|nr:hypothetical protein [Dietzia sp. UCD-THP]
MGTSHATPSGPSSTPVHGPPRTRPLNWVLLVAGVLLAVFGLGVTAAGAAILVADASQRDGQYAFTDTDRLQTVGHAITTVPLTIHVDEGATVGPYGLDDLISLQLRATPVVPDQDVFLGIADASDVAEYLDDVPHAVIGDPAVGSRVLRGSHLRLGIGDVGIGSRRRGGPR